MTNPMKRMLNSFTVKDEDYESYGDVEQMDEYREVDEVSFPSQLSAVESPSVATADSRRLFTARPRNYEDTAAIAEAFRDGVPVILNLTELDAAESRRILDFSVGVCCALEGVLRRITPGVFLLSPADFSISEATSSGTQQVF